MTVLNLLGDVMTAACERSFPPCPNAAVGRWQQQRGYRHILRLCADCGHAVEQIGWKKIS